MMELCLDVNEFIAAHRRLSLLAAVDRGNRGCLLVSFGSLLVCQHKKAALLLASTSLLAVQYYASLSGTKRLVS